MSQGTPGTGTLQAKALAWGGYHRPSDLPGRVGVPQDLGPHGGMEKASA